MENELKNKKEKRETDLVYKNPNSCCSIVNAFEKHSNCNNNTLYVTFHLLCLR